MRTRYRIAGINRSGGHVAHRQTHDEQEIDRLHDELMSLPGVHSTLLLGSYPEEAPESDCVTCGRAL